MEQGSLWRPIRHGVAEITLSTGTLFGDMDGSGKVPLVASSEIEFSGLYGLGVEFTKNGADSPEQLFVKDVSGNYLFVRKK